VVEAPEGPVFGKATNSDQKIRGSLGSRVSNSIRKKSGGKLKEKPVRGERVHRAGRPPLCGLIRY